MAQKSPSHPAERHGENAVIFDVTGSPMAAGIDGAVSQG
jgi:hypothetical protein